MECRTVVGALCCTLTSIVIVIIIIVSLIGSSSRTNTITTSGPVSLDEHDENNFVKVDGESNTVLVVLNVIFALSTVVGVCSSVFHYCKYRHLPRRRAARQAARQAALAQQQQQIHLAAIFEQLLPSGLASNQVHQPDIPMASLPIQALGPRPIAPGPRPPLAHGPRPMVQSNPTTSKNFR